MGRFDGILICSDVDGTFAHGKDVPLRNVEAIRYFQSEGGIFTFATGRYAGYTSAFPVEPNGPIVTENGARIYDAALGRTLWKFPLDGSGPVWEWIDTKSVSYVALRFTDGPVITESGKVVETILNHPAEQELLQIVCGGFASEKDALAFREEARRIFGARYDIRRSWDVGVEFISPLGTKGNCLKALKTLTESRISVAVGDYENDVTMLSAADRSFAPANACREALDAADTVLCDYREGAIADLIALLDDEYERGILS